MFDWAIMFDLAVMLLISVTALVMIYLAEHAYRYPEKHGVKYMRRKDGRLIPYTVVMKTLQHASRTKTTARISKKRKF